MLKAVLYIMLFILLVTILVPFYCVLIIIKTFA